MGPGALQAQNVRSSHSDSRAAVTNHSIDAVKKGDFRLQGEGTKALPPLSDMS